MENNRVRAKGTYRDIESIDGALIKEWNSIIVKENAIDELSRFLFNYAKMSRSNSKRKIDNIALVTFSTLDVSFFLNLD